MNDLISKSDLIRSIDVCDDIQQITVKISNATCIDVVPVVHGKWELVQKFKKPDVRKCSNCGYEEMILITDENKKRCPNCGAKMDGKDGE